MSYVVDDLTTATRLELGAQGEHGVTEIEFDVSAWALLYPAAMAVAATPGVSDGLWVSYVRRGELAVYPVEAADLAYADGTLTWTIQAAVTTNEGQGTAVVHCLLSGDEKRSARAGTVVEPGHVASTDAPAPLADYVAKWGAADATITMLAAGETATVAVTQDATGTHFAFGIPYPEPEA